VPGFGQPLVIEDRAVPVPEPGQVVIRMEASGLCHTDIHAANGDWPVTPTVPFIPGHEGVGIVTGVGEGVTSPQVGQRAGWPRTWPQEKLRFHVLAGSGVSYVIHGALSPRACRA